jgi:hypothetical protein
MSKMRTWNVLKYVGFGILGIAFIVGMVFGVQALWNWLIPELFNGPVLTFWQTVGLFILSKILLTGVAPGSRHNHRRDWRKKCDEKYRNTETKGPEIATADQG